MNGTVLSLLSQGPRSVVEIELEARDVNRQNARLDKNSE